jgi:hypothetical protein
VIEIAGVFSCGSSVRVWNLMPRAAVTQCNKVWERMMRKKAINQVYGVLKAVCSLEKDLKTGELSVEINRADCSEHLKQARHELHQVLDEVYASNVRAPKAA